MSWLRRLRAWLHPVCPACGIAHGALMTLDWQGRLRLDAPHWLIRKHYASQFKAASELAGMLP